MLRVCAYHTNKLTKNPLARSINRKYQLVSLTNLLFSHFSVKYSLLEMRLYSLKNLKYSFTQVSKCSILFKFTVFTIPSFLPKNTQLPSTRVLDYSIFYFDILAHNYFLARSAKLLEGLYILLLLIFFFLYIF